MPAYHINPEILQWAMDRSRIDVAAVASHCQREDSVVVGWLSGEQLPFTRDLRKLSTLFERPLEFFLRSTPPTDDDIYAHRRSPFPDIDVESHIERAAIDRAVSIQKTAAWLARLEDRPKVEFPEPRSSVSEWVRLVWEELNWDVRRDQIRLTSKSATFRTLRQRIEAMGCIVIVSAHPGMGTRGFSIPHPIAPLIYINDETGFAAVNTYSLLHEFAHLCIGQTSLEHDIDSNIERRCDRFAAEFLMPEPELKTYLRRTKKGPKFSARNLDDIRLIASHFKSSWLSVAIRLKELGLAGQDLVSAVKNGEPRDGGGPGGPPQTRALKRAREYGSRYPELLFSAVSEQKLGELDALRYLKLEGRSEYREMSQLVGRPA